MVAANPISVFDRAILSKAVAAQRAAYSILRWLTDAVRDHQIPAEAVHLWLTSRDTVLRWSSEWPKCLPGCVDSTCLSDSDTRSMTAHILASFLESTLNIVANPGKRTVFTSDCRCDVCGKLVTGSHLRPKKIDRLDRAAADRERSEALADIAATECPEEITTIHHIVDASPDGKMYLALVAYGRHLLRRGRGEHDTTATALVLWREFAWTSAGDPKAQFRLTADLVLQAEGHIRNLIGK